MSLHDATDEGETEATDEGETEATNGSGSKLSESDRHRLLASARRRLTLDVLAGTATAVDLEAVAAAVATRDGIDPSEETEIERVAIELHHVHLPKMADLGVIDYDPEFRIVEPRGVDVDSMLVGR